MITPQEQSFIAAEYMALCRALGLTPVTLDIYEIDNNPASTALSAHGHPLASGAAAYSAT